MGYEGNPQIMPVVQMDDSGNPVGVTSNSFVVQFAIVPEQELNGRIDR